MKPFFYFYVQVFKCLIIDTFSFLGIAVIILSIE